uniref:NS1 n=1 Tax=Simian parvo-like virus 1 TaxID=1917073 RepID=A0A1W5PTD4_9VIRU|nr:NS1 [Simian parvo-like virus 1]
MTHYILGDNEISAHSATLNMQTWQGVVIVVGRGDGTILDLDNPRPIAFCLSSIKNVQDFIIVGENNDDGILHFHCLCRTLMRGDSLQRSILNKWETHKLAAMEDIEEPEPTMEICKCQKAHRPEALLCYMVKNPLFIAAHNPKSLQYAYSLYFHNKGQKYLDKKEAERQRKQTLPIETISGGHPITRDILSIIYKYNCLTSEDIFKHEPDIIIQHLHKPGFANIIKNCLAFVEATKGEWSLEKNAHRYRPDPTAIHMCINHQGLDTEDIDYTFYQWITKKHPKKNTILLIGPSNTGKSAFIRGLRGVFETGEICNGQVFCPAPGAWTRRFACNMQSKEAYKKMWLWK